MLQLTQLFSEFDVLHVKHGSESVHAIYGAGQIRNPKICLIFMNPTAKNISSHSHWTGIRAPWIGTKNVWKLFFQLNLFSNKDMISKIMHMKPSDWNADFAEELYSKIASDSLYITNIAKCTQDDARHISNRVYEEYLPLMFQELNLLNPQCIITFGNQVSCTLLQKKISVSSYLNNEYEIARNDKGKDFKIYPTYYPIGHGTWNMKKAAQRINTILKELSYS